MAPTTHGNFRYFEIIDKTTGEVLDYWFGGGTVIIFYIILVYLADDIYVINILIKVSI
jgi:coproporphyrinogen III oxidase